MAHAFPAIFALERDHGSLVRGGFAMMRGGDRSRPRFKRLLASFSGGLDRLPEAMAVELGARFRGGRRLVALRREGERWLAETATRDGIERHEAARVILALPPHAFAALELDPDLAARLRPLDGIVYPPVATVALGFRREDVRHPLDGFGALAPRAEGLTILGALFSSTLFPDRAPADHVLFTCYLGGALSPETAHLSERDALERTTRDLDRLFGLCGAPVFTRHAVNERAIPQYEIGYERFLAAMGKAERAHAGLHLAGSFRGGISVSAAILSGIEVAERIGGVKRHGQDTGVSA
jgi:oxygen-dependent protoporphyrinogen oxidase